MTHTPTNPTTQMHQGLTHQGTDGRTYGDDPNLVHIPDHHRRTVGSIVADHLDATMRAHSIQDPDLIAEAPLCPGCFMIALLDAAVWLARRNGQPLAELGATLAEAFAKLSESPDAHHALLEEIHVRASLREPGEDLYAALVPDLAEA